MNQLYDSWHLTDETPSCRADSLCKVLKSLFIINNLDPWRDVNAAYSIVIALIAHHININYIYIYSCTPSVTKGWSRKMYVQTAHCSEFYCPCCRARAILPVFAVAKREGSTFVQHLAEQIAPGAQMHLYMTSSLINELCMHLLNMARSMARRVAKRASSSQQKIPYKRSKNIQKISKDAFRLILHLSVFI